MAKLENVTKKSKGKKRKHTASENDEEVESKSLIVETNETQLKEQTESTNKSLKRKSKEKSKIREKRNKRDDDNGKNSTQSIGDSGDEESFEPTLEELQESEKPENVSAIVTVRQKKKEKHQHRLKEQKNQTVDKEKQRNEEYLQKWKHSRIDWKFEKLRQISLQQSVFDEEKLSVEMWPLALDYLSGTKGAAREKITKLAEEYINQLDRECEQKQTEEEQQVIVDSIKYQRARDLLQSFD